MMLYICVKGNISQAARQRQATEANLKLINKASTYIDDNEMNTIAVSPGKCASRDKPAKG